MILKFSDIIKTKEVIADTFLNKNLFIFFSKEYPGLFFSYVFQKLKNDHNLKIVNINLLEREFSEIRPQLEMSFLGNTSFYWLGNLSELSEKKAKEILDYLNMYTGPNQIAVFLQEPVYAKASSGGPDITEKKLKEEKFAIISCDNLSTQEQFENFVDFVSIKKEIALNYFHETIALTNSLTLDQAFILTYYIRLIGKKADDFLDNWLDKIFVTEQSLFTLSKYFFSGQSDRGRLFFNYLNLISPNYQPVFWTTFWSEQLFRAYWYVKFMNMGRIVEAKQIAYRLPFSFIQYDWKKHNLERLQSAHQLIYDIDYTFKNGGSEHYLDLFYAKFFEKY